MRHYAITFAGLVGPVAALACSSGASAPGSTFEAMSAMGADAGGGSALVFSDGSALPDVGAHDAALVSDAADSAMTSPPPSCTDPCACDPPNGDLAHATPYVPGTDISACLTSTGDVDFYEFETPAGSPGGTVVVSVGYMGLDTLDPAVFVGSDATEIFDQEGAAGGSASLWFAAAPSTKYSIEVQTSYAYGQSPYTLNATYTPVSSPTHPGTTKSNATPIAVGTPVQALMFAGYTGDMLDITAWWQWYQVTLADGNANVSLTNVPSDLTLEVYLYDSTSNANTIHGYGSSASAGGSIAFTTTAPVTAGTYYLQVEPVEYTTQAYGGGTTPGAFATQPYTLGVTQ